MPQPTTHASPRRLKVHKNDDFPAETPSGKMREPTHLPQRLVIKPR